MFTPLRPAPDRGVPGPGPARVDQRGLPAGGGGTGARRRHRRGADANGWGSTRTTSTSSPNRAPWREHAAQAARLAAGGADADTWIGPASGPEGKRAFGGQFVAQSLAAACRTVDADRLPTNMHLQFLRGGEAGDPVEYTVTRVFDGRTAAARRVDSRQDGRLADDLDGVLRRRPARPRTRPLGPRCRAIPTRCRRPGRPAPRRRCRWTNSTSGSPTTARAASSCGGSGGGQRFRLPDDRIGAHPGRGIRHRCVHDRPRAAGARAFDEGPQPSQRHDRFVDLVPPAGPRGPMEPAGVQVTRRRARTRRRDGQPDPRRRRHRGHAGAGRAYRRAGYRRGDQAIGTGATRVERY